MSNYTFQIKSQSFTISNLDDSMNEFFRKLYESHLSGTSLDINNFELETFNFYNKNINRFDKHDSYFSNYTILWRLYLSNGHLSIAEQLWDFSLNIAYKWEQLNSGKRIHKGTPYYFWGTTCILKGDYENGFLLMHQALNEDIKTHNNNKPLTPSYFFVTLDYDKFEQFFRSKVLEMSDFLNNLIKEYNISRNGNLTTNTFKTVFLDNYSIIDTVFTFVFTLFNLKKISIDINDHLTQNQFASLIQADIIFRLCKIVDITVKNKNQSQWKFIDHLDFLSRNTSLTLIRSKSAEANSSFNNDFSNTIDELLNSRYHFQDGSSPQFIEEDFLLAYGFRNFVAHNIENQPIIYRNFIQLYSRILYSLFFIIENLYV